MADTEVKPEPEAEPKTAEEIMQEMRDEIALLRQHLRALEFAHTGTSEL